MQTSMKSYFKKAILAVALFVGFMSLDAKAGLQPGIYPAYHSSTCNPCCYVPANNCIIIVIVVQAVYSDGSFGPVGAIVPSSDPEWQFQTNTLIENNTIRFNNE